MKRKTITLCLFSMTVLCLCSISAAVELEPFTYTQNFETRELSAWASYPLWQDTAYDPHFYAGTIVPGDPNISVIQKVTPYTNVENYAGAQKKLDMYMNQMMKNQQKKMMKKMKKKNQKNQKKKKQQ